MTNNLEQAMFSVKSHSAHIWSDARSVKECRLHGMCSLPPHSSSPRIPQRHKGTDEVLVLTAGHTLCRIATAHNLHAMTSQTSFRNSRIQLTTMREFADVCLNARLLQSLRFQSFCSAPMILSSRIFISIYVLYIL